MLHEPTSDYTWTNAKLGDVVDVVHHDPSGLPVHENMRDDMHTDGRDHAMFSHAYAKLKFVAHVDAGPMSISHWGMIDLGRFGVVYMPDGAHWQEDGETFEVVRHN